MKLKEMPRQTQWVESQGDITLPERKGGQTIGGARITVNAKYPGLAYADMNREGHKFVVLHTQSGKPLFYNVRDKLLARKLMALASEQLTRAKLSWDIPEADIMRSIQRYAPIIQGLKKKFGRSRGGRGGKADPGKYD